MSNKPCIYTKSGRSSRDQSPPAINLSPEYRTLLEKIDTISSYQTFRVFGSNEFGEYVLKEDIAVSGHIKTPKGNISPDELSKLAHYLRKNTSISPSAKEKALLRFVDELIPRFHAY